MWTGSDTVPRERVRAPNTTTDHATDDHNDQHTGKGQGHGMTESKAAKKAARIKELEAQAAEIQAEIDMLKGQIKEDMEANGKDEMKAGDYRITWRECFSNRLDSKRIKAELPDVYEKYLSINITRRFCIA